MGSDELLPLMTDSVDCGAAEYLQYSQNGLWENGAIRKMIQMWLVEMKGPGRCVPEEDRRCSQNSLWERDAIKRDQERLVAGQKDPRRCVPEEGHSGNKRLTIPFDSTALPQAVLAVLTKDVGSFMTVSDCQSIHSILWENDIHSPKLAPLAARATLQAASLIPVTGERFVPDIRLRETLHSTSIRKELDKSNCTLPDLLLDAYVRVTCHGAQDLTSFQCQHESLMRMFAILVFFDRPQSIGSFMGDGFDSSMPQLSFTQTSANSHADAYGSCFDGWNLPQMENFDENQWTVLPTAPEKSSASLKFPQLDAHYILPITEDCKDGPSSTIGGFSRVYKVRIHTGHFSVHTISDDSTSAFALKMISPSKRSAYDFSKEIEALAKFSSPDTDHPHIIKLLAAFSHDDKHCLLFPWADGNLRTFWRENSTPSMNTETIAWLAGQLAGLTDALRAIHQYSLRDGLSLFGRHSDIKPSNILVFKNQNDGVRFCIADFGLTRFHSSEAHLNRDQPKAITPTYRPPEFDLRNPMSQKADIWSLGCVFLEMMVWVLEGYHGLKCFVASRMVTNQDTAAVREKHDAFFVLNQFDRQKGLVPSIKPSVEKCMDQLYQAANCSPFSFDVLDLIEHEMLCVDEQERSTSCRILQRLQEIQEKCRKESEYTAPRPCPLKPPWILRHPKHTHAHRTSQTKDISQVDQDIDLNNIPIRVSTTHISTHCQSEHPNNTSKLSSQYLSKLLKTSSESPFEQFPPKEQYFKMPPNMLDSASVEAVSRQYSTELYKREAPENRKRKLNADIPEIGEEYPQKRVHTETDQQSPQQKAQAGLRIFACPFWKRFPDNFVPGTNEWNTCACKRWTTHRLKEHIERAHTIYRCPRCFQTFKKQDALTKHQRDTPPCTTVSKQPECEGEGVDENLKAELRKRRIGKTDEEKWSEMYRIIFKLKKSDKIPSPYWEQQVNSEPKTQQSLSAFREHLVTLSRDGNSEEQNEARICMKNLQKFEDLMTESESLSYSATNLTTLPTLTNDSTVSDFASQEVQQQNPFDGQSEEAQTELESLDTTIEQISSSDFDWENIALDKDLEEFSWIMS